MLVRGITPVGDADQFPCLYVEETQISLGPSQVARQNHLRLRSLISSVKSMNMDRRLLERAPAAAIGSRQIVHRPRAVASGWIIRERRRRGILPCFQDWVYQSPGSLDSIGAVKQRGVSADAIINKGGVGGARAAAKRILVFKIHGHRLDAHLRARRFCAEGK